MSTAKTLKNLTLSAVFIALITTSIFFVRVTLPWGGVIHFGDALVWIAAAILPFPYGLAVAALGPGLFNLFAGLTMWFPFTIIIKPVTALFFTSRESTILSKRNTVAPFIAGAVNMVLYFAATISLFAFGVLATDEPNIWIAGAIALPGDVVQACGSIASFFIISAVLDKIKFKKLY
ncbi:MAG: ECF transporter S component [Oscillospiraceae bacterium]|nr:ECF transporter S component [Oscillospiraceae bacterium]